MRVSAITVHGAAGWPSVGLADSSGTQLTAICGPTNSGKTTMAGLIGHALFGKEERGPLGATLPEGELIVEGNRRTISAAARARCAAGSAADGGGARWLGRRSSDDAAAGGRIVAERVGAAVRGEFPRVAATLGSCCRKSLPSGFKSITRTVARKHRVARQNWPRDAICSHRNWKRDSRLNGGRAANWKRGGASWIDWRAIEQQQLASLEAAAAVGARNRWRKPMRGCVTGGWS